MDLSFEDLEADVRSFADATIDPLISRELLSFSTQFQVTLIEINLWDTNRSEDLHEQISIAYGSGGAQVEWGDVLEAEGSVQGESTSLVSIIRPVTIEVAVHGLLPHQNLFYAGVVSQFVQMRIEEHFAAQFA